MLRLVRALLLAAIAVCFVAPPASATQTGLGETLGNMWKTILETPTPDNPFAGGDGDGCFVLGGKTVAPLKPGGVDFCTVERGTRIFVSAWTTECSSFEGNGMNEAELRACAVAADAGIAATITVDDRPVPVYSVESELLKIHLPKNNIFGLKGADRKGLSVAHGLVFLTGPVAKGTHTIVGLAESPEGATRFTTRIIVQ